MTKNQNKDKKQKNFVNPAQKPWGKVLIAILAVSFIVATLALVIYFIISNITTV